MKPIDNFLFIGLPYLALALFLVGSIYRFSKRGFKFSSLSSEFLEGRQLFWGSVPFHFGVIFIFVGHLVAFLFPRTVLAWNGQPLRLVILEVAAFVFALSMLAGLLGLIMRRVSTDRIKMVTTKMDYLILLLLLFQAITGILIAYTSRWGSSWFAAVLTPYLRSLLTFSPDINAVANMNWIIKLHVAGAFAVIAMVPFSRLVHFLVPPIPYLWRPYQRVMWNWNRKAIRKAETPWNLNPPKNN